MAMLLKDDREHNARIQVEQIIRDDYVLESYELIKQYAEMLTARINVLQLEPELARRRGRGDVTVLGVRHGHRHRDLSRQGRDGAEQQEQCGDAQHRADDTARAVPDGNATPDLLTCYARNPTQRPR